MRNGSLKRPARDGDGGTGDDASNLDAAARSCSASWLRVIGDEVGVQGNHGTRRPP